MGDRMSGEARESIDKLAKSSVVVHPIHLYETTNGGGSYDPEEERERKVERIHYLRIIRYQQLGRVIQMQHHAGPVQIGYC